MKTFSLLYKDKNVAIINKPAETEVSDCIAELSNYLAFSAKKTQPRDFCVLPKGNLDKAVSGIQMFCLNTTIAREVDKYWNSPRIKNGFLALVKGGIANEANFCFPLLDERKEKQNAITVFSPVKHFGVATLLKVHTETHCKHQIRRHFSRRCMNVVGDRKFGHRVWNEYFERQMGLKRIFLHSSQLTLDLKSYNRILEINCPLPDPLETVLQKLSCYCPSPLFGSNHLEEKTS